MFGNSEDELWSGSYFIVNYLTMFILFNNEKNKVNRIIGISLSLTLLFYVFIKYFFQIDFERYFTIIPLCVSLFSIYKLEKK